MLPARPLLCHSPAAAMRSGLVLGGDPVSPGGKGTGRTLELGGGDLALLVGVPLLALSQELAPAALDLLPQLILNGLAVLQGRGRARGGLAR